MSCHSPTKCILNKTWQLVLHLLLPALGYQLPHACRGTLLKAAKDSVNTHSMQSFSNAAVLQACEKN